MMEILCCAQMAPNRPGGHNPRDESESRPLSGYCRFQFMQAPGYRLGFQSLRIGKWYATCNGWRRCHWSWQSAIKCFGTVCRFSVAAKTKNQYDRMALDNVKHLQNAVFVYRVDDLIRVRFGVPSTGRVLFWLCQGFSVSNSIWNSWLFRRLMLFFLLTVCLECRCHWNCRFENICLFALRLFVCEKCRIDCKWMTTCLWIKWLIARYTYICSKLNQR